MGRSTIIGKRWRVAVAYSKANGGSCPNITAIVKKCKVGWHYTIKVENELDVHGRLLCEDELCNFNKDDIGPGSRSLDNRDVYATLILYFDQSSPNKPTRSKLIR